MLFLENFPDVLIYYIFLFSCTYPPYGVDYVVEDRRFLPWMPSSTGALFGVNCRLRRHCMKVKLWFLHFILCACCLVVCECVFIFIVCLFRISFLIVLSVTFTYVILLRLLSLRVTNLLPGRSLSFGG